jgi:hypothetical protein
MSDDLFAWLCSTGFLVANAIEWWWAERAALLWLVAHGDSLRGDRLDNERWQPALIRWRHMPLARGAAKC